MNLRRDLPPQSATFVAINPAGPGGGGGGPFPGQPGAVIQDSS